MRAMLDLDAAGGAFGSPEICKPPKMSTPHRHHGQAVGTVRLDRENVGSQM